MQQKLSVILISGGSCSGKSTFATLFHHAFILEMDHFYVGKSHMTPAADGNYNFDDPASVDLVECSKAIDALLSDGTAVIPTYDMVTSERVGTQTITVPEGTKFLIVEGIFAFQSPIRERGNVLFFVDTPAEIRVARRMIRDVEKGRSDIDTLEWSITVEKNHKKFIEPMKQYADVVIPFSYNPVKFAT